MKYLFLAIAITTACAAPVSGAMYEIAVPTAAVGAVIFDGRPLETVSVSIPAVMEPGAILSGLLEVRVVPESGEDGASAVEAAAFRDGSVVIPEGKTGPVAAYAFGESEVILQLDITPILRQGLSEGRNQETLVVGRVSPDALGEGNVVSLSESEGIWARLILHLKEM